MVLLGCQLPTGHPEASWPGLQFQFPLVQNTQAPCLSLPPLGCCGAEPGVPRPGVNIFFQPSPCFCPLWPMCLALSRSAAALTSGSSAHCSAAGADTGRGCRELRARATPS